MRRAQEREGGGEREMVYIDKWESFVEAAQQV